MLKIVCYNKFYCYIYIIKTLTYVYYYSIKSINFIIDVGNLISKCIKENEKSELFSKVFSSILADGCRTAIQKSKNINKTMEEALISIIQNTSLSQHEN